MTPDVEDVARIYWMHKYPQVLEEFRNITDRAHSDFMYTVNRQEIQRAKQETQRMYEQLAASMRKANRSGKKPVHDNEEGEKTTPKRTPAPNTVTIKVNAKTTLSDKEKKEKANSSTRIKRTVPKAARRKCMESVLTARNLHTEKGFVNEGKKLASSRKNITLKGKPQRTKKVAKRKSTTKQKDEAMDSEDEASSEETSLVTSSGETDDADRKKGKDDLNFDTAEVWKRNSREVMKMPFF